MLLPTQPTAITQPQFSKGFEVWSTGHICLISDSCETIFPANDLCWKKYKKNVQQFHRIWIYYNVHRNIVGSLKCNMQSWTNTWQIMQIKMHRFEMDLETNIKIYPILWQLPYKMKLIRSEKSWGWNVLLGALLIWLLIAIEIPCTSVWLLLL